MRDRLTSETVFEFDAAPAPNAIRAWLSTLGDAKIEGNAVRVRMSMDEDEARRNFSLIALSPLGRRLAPIVNSARYLPVRDTATTVHTGRGSRGKSCGRGKGEEVLRSHQEVSG